MTTVAHLWRAIQDSRTGGILIGATVSLCTPGTDTPIGQTLYSDVELTQALANPFVSSNGLIDVYLAEPVTVQIKTAYGSSVERADNIAVLPLAEEIVVTTVPFTVINGPGTDLFLTGVDAATAEFRDLGNTLASKGSVVLGWFQTQALQFNNITRDTNGAMVAADVTWPDGVSGTYAADVVSTVFPGKVDAWSVTRTTDSSTTTYTQPTITRDDNGDIVSMPTVTVA